MLSTISDSLHAAAAIYGPMIASRDEEIANWRQRTAYQNAVIQRIENEKRSLEDQQRVMREERSNLVATRDSTLRAYASLFQSHEATRSELAHSEHVREALLGSTSWRVTAPFRWLASRALSGTKVQC